MLGFRLAGSMAMILVASSSFAAPKMFRFDPAHTGVIPGPASGAYGGFLWRIQTGGTVRSTPAESEGILYIGANDGFIRAIRAETGNVLWKSTAGAPVTSSPALDESNLYIVTQDGRAVAMEKLRGRIRWTYQIGKDAPVWQGINGDYWTSSVTLVGQTAYIGGGNGDVVALDTKSGKRRWKFHAETRFHTTPAVAGGMVYLGGFDGVFYAIDATTGKQIWTYRTLSATLDSSRFGFDRQTIQSSAAVADGRVFFGARDGLLYCLDAKTGHLKWQFDHGMSWVNTSPAVSEGVVYAGSSDKRFLQAVEASTGKELWRVKTGLMWTAPAVQGDSVYTTDGDGHLTAFDKKSGHQRWQVGSGKQIWTSPFLSRTHGVYGSDDGGIYCFRTDSAISLERCVYWDKAEEEHTLSDFPAIKDGLVKKGYSLLDNAKLGDFLRDRIADHKPSVVVMAMGIFPTQAPANLAMSYMRAGGKIVWCGIPPDMWPVGKGGVDMADIDWKATKVRYGVQPRTIFDSLGTMPTEEGSKWGLHGMWLSDFAADPTTVTKVLARDDRGLAAVWLKSYGGRPGSGLLRICGMRLPEGPEFLSMLTTAAETFPRA